MSVVISFNCVNDCTYYIMNVCYMSEDILVCMCKWTECAAYDCV